MYANTESAQKLVDRMIAYGVRASGEVVDHEYHEQVSYDNLMSLAELVKRGGRVTRLRVLKEYGRYDISYAHGTLPDGTIVPLRLGWNTVGGNWRQIKGDLIEWAKEEGVFAKGCGLLDDSNWAVLG